jgi:hypothetical protein
VATIGDGSCIIEAEVVYGCTDVRAANYNPYATDYEKGSCRYADEENTILVPEVPEIPEDTIGTRAIEDCRFTAANIISASIVKVEVSDIDESGNNHGKNQPPHLHAYLTWEIVKETPGNGREVISERVQYCLDGKNNSMDNQPTLFYLSAVCKNPLYLRAGQEDPEVIAYTFSAFAYLNYSTDIYEPGSEAISGVVVYPNPFTDWLTVSVKGANTVNIALYSVTGAQIASYSNLNEVQIATSKLPAGVYVVKVTTDGKVETVKVVKK